MNNDESNTEVAAWLAGAPIPPLTFDRLHRLLEDGADREGMLDIAYRTLDSPVGLLLIAATERGLIRVAYARENHDQVLELLARKISPRILRAPKRLDPAAVEIDQYFSGTRMSFDLPLNRSLARGFRQLVQDFLPSIDYGKTRSYAEVAASVGNPKAVRAVGTACATNPLPIVVPCHRVIRSDGTFGPYVGGTEAKETLLRMEARR